MNGGLPEFAPATLVEEAPGKGVGLLISTNQKKGAGKRGPGTKVAPLGFVLSRSLASLVGEAAAARFY